MSTRYRISVDRTVCQGSGLCAGMAPDFFTLDSTHRAAPVAEVVDADSADLEAVMDAAECCPTEAITVVDADTNQPVT